MIPLHGRTHAHLDGLLPLERTVWRLAGRETTAQEGLAYLVEDGESPPVGYGLYLAHADNSLPPQFNHIVLPEQLGYLSPGDILSLSRDGERARVLWRHQSRQNSILLTERCDNYCLMCSQPPKEVDDGWLLEEASELIRLLPPSATAVILTGGEPTIYGERLIELLTLCRERLPGMGIHILSNGRRFADPGFARDYAAIDHPNMMVGIPIYGTEPVHHDYVVQAHGAFDETIRGILNLGRLEQAIEIRVVIHKQTAPVLVEVADFIARNLPFVNQVALMGLEMMGFARANLNDVWIDPIEYREDLTHAALRLDRVGIKTMIYNHQLCLIERAAWRFAVKSISDWKNEYIEECDRCAVRDRCGGFFHSAKYRRSDHIRAIPRDVESALVVA